jgi:hypothetical protein
MRARAGAGHKAACSFAMGRRSINGSALLIEHFQKLKKKPSGFIYGIRAEATKRGE